MKEFSIMIQGTISSWTEDTMSLLTVEKLGHTFGIVHYLKMYLCDY